MYVHVGVCSPWQQLKKGARLREVPGFGAGGGGGGGEFTTSK